MAAIHLLRSQISLLYSSKFQFVRRSINSLITHNQKPNLSRHFRPIHLITPKSSPRPTSGGCRTFSNAQIKPTDSIKNVGSNREEELRNRVRKRMKNRVNSSSNGAKSVVPRNSVGSNGVEESGNQVNLSSNMSHSVVPRNVVGREEKGNSVDSNGEEESRNRVNLSSNVSHSIVLGNFVGRGEKGKSVGSNREVGSNVAESVASRNFEGRGVRGKKGKKWMKNRVNSSSNGVKSVVPRNSVGRGEEGKSVDSIREKEFRNRVYMSLNVAKSVASRNFDGRGEGGEKGNSVGSNGEEESGNRVNLSSNVAESVVQRDFVGRGEKGKSAGSNGEEELRNRVNLSSNVAKSAVSRNFVGRGEKGNSVGSNREEELGNLVNLSSNVAESIVARNFVQGGQKGSSVGSNGEEESGNLVNLSSNVAESVVPSDFVRRGEKGNSVVSNGEEESGNLVNLSSNAAESVVPRNFVGGGEKGNSVASNGEEESSNWVYLSSNVAKSVDSRNIVGRGEKGNSKMYPVCADCGHSTAQWRGICRLCNEIGTLKQFSVSENEASGNMMKSSWLPEQMVGQNIPVRLMDVNRGINHMEGRIRLAGLFGLEVNRVLGGGVVPGSLILVGGDPGVGKRTLALQMAALIAGSFDVGGAAPVLYISSEESVEQIGNRADRLSVNTEDLFGYSSTAIEDILEKVQLVSPCAVVVDSIQSVYLKGVTGSPGGLMQVEECTSALLRFAKQTNIPVLLIGHVNKNGEVAGPRDLEHIVDVVLYMEGEKHPSHRLLHSVKNRFGSTDELGVFEMSESGLEAVSNPSEMFLSEEHSDSVHLVGLAIAVIIDGSRSLLVKVQASCVSGPVVSRHVNGVQLSRAGMILSVLQNQVGLKLGDHSINLNVISGVSLTDTSGDLAVAAAVCSSFLEFPLPNNVAFIGEIGLGGELLMVPRLEKRVITLAKLGYKKCVVPESAGKALAAISSEMQIVGCKNLTQVIDKVFSTCKF